MTSDGVVWAMKHPPLFVGGNWVIQVIDEDDEILASGAITSGP